MNHAEASADYICMREHQGRRQCTLGRYHRLSSEPIQRLPISKAFYCKACLKSPSFASEVEHFLRKFRHSLLFDADHYQAIIKEFKEVFGERKMKKAMELVEEYKDL